MSGTRCEETLPEPRHAPDIVEGLARITAEAAKTENLVRHYLRLSYSYLFDVNISAASDFGGK
jgi:hypothetical protein